VRFTTRQIRETDGTAIELVEVSKRFRSDRSESVAAVTDVSLTIPQGSTVLLRGPSGSGKTTLLGLIACLIRPTRGRVRIGEREVTRLPEEHVAQIRRRCFGFVFQDNHLIRGASALDNVMLPAVPRADVNGELRHDAVALLARLGLQGRERQRVERLSGGERQRVAIARALINDPPVFVADEPTAHLDAASAGSLLAVLRELRQEGRTVLVASHDPEICGAGCFTRVLELRHGRLYESGGRACC